MLVGKAQEFLFQRIKEKLPHGDSLAESIGSILHVSSDSAYRRIRGETALTLNETSDLCSFFGISMDMLLHAGSRSVSFEFCRLEPGQYSFTAYLSDILGKLKDVHGSRQKQIICLTKDIPLFQQFLFKPLFEFRYFFWMKFIVQDPAFQQRQFAFDSLPLEVENLGHQIISTYSDIPSVEIWNAECVSSVIYQIEYFAQAGTFRSKADVLRIYDSLLEWLHHLRVQAEFGVKYLPGQNPEFRPQNFQLYYNQLILGDNTMLATAGSVQTAYVNYNTLNYLQTSDRTFCEQLQKELNSLMRRSAQISVVGEKQRNGFFGIMEERIRDATKKM